MGEAAEVAGDGVWLAVLGREGAPGVDGAGEGEDGIHAGAEVADLAACGGAGEDVGEEGVELGGGEGGGGHGHSETEATGKSNIFLSYPPSDAIAQMSTTAIV